MVFSQGKQLAYKNRYDQKFKNFRKWLKQSSAISLILKGFHDNCAWWLEALHWIFWKGRGKKRAVGGKGEGAGKQSSVGKS